MSDGAEIMCGGRLPQKFVPENWKSLFADGGEVKQQYCKLVEGSRSESLLGRHIGDNDGAKLVSIH